MLRQEGCSSTARTRQLQEEKKSALKILNYYEFTTHKEYKDSGLYY